MKPSIAILCAGCGTRMNSDLPKVLHLLAGRSLLQHVYDTACTIPHRKIYVVYNDIRLKEQCCHFDAEWVQQGKPLGTGHAVSQLLPHLQKKESLLVLYGDVPLITTTLLKKLLNASAVSGSGFITCKRTDPKGYGRVIRDKTGAVIAITEEKDASKKEREIHEVNSGLMAMKVAKLDKYLSLLSNNNSQKEYYLTEIIGMAAADGSAVATVTCKNNVEVSGINNRYELVTLERAYQKRMARSLLDRGVTVVDPNRFDVRGALQVGKDTRFDINVILEGKNRIGKRVTIGANCCLRDCVIGNDVEIFPHTIMESATIADGCSIGPFARIRPGSNLKKGVRIGNFVEVKKSTIGSDSKINHLNYVGDSQIGQGVNIGAGSITCNYDGTRKHQTIIGNAVFVGSDCQLVAPVKIGQNTVIGAGTTVTKNVPANSLVTSRAPQKITRRRHRAGERLKDKPKNK